MLFRSFNRQLATAILTEVGVRKGAMAWLWGCTTALLVPAVLYWWLVVPPVLPD